MLVRENKLSSLDKQRLERRRRLKGINRFLDYLHSFRDCPSISQRVAANFLAEIITTHTTELIDDPDLLPALVRNELKRGQRKIPHEVLSYLDPFTICSEEYF